MLVHFVAREVSRRRCGCFTMMPDSLDGDSVSKAPFSEFSQCILLLLYIKTIEMNLPTFADARSP